MWRLLCLGFGAWQVFLFHEQWHHRSPSSSVPRWCLHLALGCAVQYHARNKVSSGDYLVQAFRDKRLFNIISYSIKAGCPLGVRVNVEYKICVKSLNYAALYISDKHNKNTTQKNYMQKVSQQAKIWWGKFIVAKFHR